MGSASLLHVLFITTQYMGELQRMFHAVCSAPDTEEADKSPPLLYGASYSERDYQEEKVNGGAAKYTISYLSSASL